MNPIISRELLELLRTKKAIALQFALALACALFVLVRWPTGEVVDLSGARSQQVLRIFGYGLLGSILLMVPAFPSTTIVKEKIKGTLALLFNSPMTPISIYVGKLFGVLGFTLILLVMTFPAAAACYALGGVGSEAGITKLYGILAIAALQLSTLGLLVSSRSQSTDGAMRWTYALVLCISILPMVPIAMLRGGDTILTVAAQWFQYISPIPAVMAVLGQGDVGTQGLSGAPMAIPGYIALALLMSAACAYFTITYLDHKMFDKARSAGVMTQDRSVMAQIFRRLFFLVDPQRRSGNMPLFLNPVMVKEFSTRRFGGMHWMLRLVGIAAILSLGVSYIALQGALDWTIEDVGGGLVLLQTFLLLLFTPSLASGLIASERESGTWQLLRMTPLSPGRILRGKLYSVAWPLFLLLCATLPGYVVLMAIKPVLLLKVQRVITCLVLLAVFSVLVSATVSTFFRSTAIATTTTYLVLFLICGGTLLVWLARGAPFGHSTVETVLSINPVAAALQASDFKGFTEYNLTLTNWWIIGSACVVLLVVLTIRTWQLCQPD